MINSQLTSLTLCDKQSVKKSIKIVKKIEIVSDLEINIDKCECMWVGELKDNSDISERISFNNDLI